MAYKPLGEDYAVVFDERQIQEIDAGLAINLGDANRNQDNTLSQGYYNVNKNTCKVTIQDPYLDGLAWGALGEIDKNINNVSRQRSKAGDFLPKCGPGQTPEEDGCRRYALLDTKNLKNKPGQGRPWIIITLWYDVAGRILEQTFYYQATQVNITHGASGEPTVSLTGKAAVAVSLQQTLNSIYFEKGKNLIDEINNKTDIQSEGFKLEDVCSTPADTFKVDGNYRLNNMTTDEVLAKFGGSIDGAEILSLPTKDFAGRVQICAAQDGRCSLSRVFYLGKGLYESYTINSKFELSQRDANLQNGGLTGDSNAGSGDSITYTVYRGDPQTTSQKLQRVNSSAFIGVSSQFTELEDYNTGESTNGWKGTGTPDTGSGGTLKVEKVENVMLFNTARNANNFLGGRVIEEGDGRVLIESEYHIQYCSKGGDGKERCALSKVMQEFKNLESISYGDSKDLNPGDSVGTISSEKDKETKTRYVIKIGRDDGIKEVTMDPRTLQGIISCTEELNPGERPAEESPSDESEQNIGNKIGEIGSTGASTGPHLHAEWTDKRFIDYDTVLKYVDIRGAVSRNSPYGPRTHPITGEPGKLHTGVDLGAAEGTEMFVKNGAEIVNADRGVLDENGYGFNVIIKTPEGTMLLGHLKAGSIPNSIPNPDGSAGTGYNSQSSAGGASPSGPSTGITEDGIQLKTNFKGIPKALYILPGRTVLSFVTDYDNWVKSNKPDTIEPGVWIPEKYRNWVVVKTNYKWQSGDLRVEIEGRRPFRQETLLRLDQVPKYPEHEAERGYFDYYDYIRSDKDLCYGDSCTKCTAYTTGSSSGSSSNFTGANDITDTYPPGKFVYTCSQYDSGVVQAIINASAQAGVTSAAGLAGIVGNAIQESSLRPSIIGDNGAALGIFQWNGPRKRNLENHAAEVGGNPASLNTQMSWFVRELQGYSGMIGRLNATDSVSDATVIFESEFERARTPMNDLRIGYAKEIFNCLKAQ